MNKIFLHENGNIQEKILGQDIEARHTPQVICPSGVWKAYDLMNGKFALVGEAVASGFNYQDMKMPTLKDFQQQYSQHIVKLKKYIHPSS